MNSSKTFFTNHLLYIRYFFFFFTTAAVAVAVADTLVVGDSTKKQNYSCNRFQNKFFYFSFLMHLIWLHFTFTFSFFFSAFLNSFSPLLSPTSFPIFLPFFFLMLPQIGWLLYFMVNIEWTKKRKKHQHSIFAIIWLYFNLQ